MYEENVDYINKHNVEFQNGMHTFTLGINEYSDLSTDEWKMFLLGEDVYGSSDATIEEDKINIENEPASVDWRTKVG